MKEKMNFENALILATKYHKGQKRWGGEPYITHPIAVAGKFKSEDIKIVAILHDMIEDTEMTISRLYVLGYPQKIVYPISLLTHKKPQSYLNYILKIKTNIIARNVKIEDIKHNLSDLKDGSMKDKYQLALHILEK